MKARGVFAIFAKVALACAMYVKDVFNTRGHSTGGSGKVSGYMSIPAPMCHTQKKKYYGNSPRRHNKKRALKERTR
jgi:hypothetical protein